MLQDESLVDDQDAEDTRGHSEVITNGIQPGTEDADRSKTARQEAIGRVRKKAEQQASFKSAGSPL